MENLERVTIIPGWTLRPENNWYEAAADYIRKSTGADVQVVGLPNPDNPDPEECTSMLHDAIVEPEKHLVIPHSLAFMVAVNWVAREVQMDSRFKLGGIIPVAANINAVGFHEIAPHFDYPEPFTEDDLSEGPDSPKRDGLRQFGEKMEIVRQVLQYRPTVIHGEHDQFVPFEHARVIRELLDGDMVVDRSQAHFSGMYAPENSDPIPATQDVHIGEAFMGNANRTALYGQMPWYAIGMIATDMVRASYVLHQREQAEIAAMQAPENSGDPVLDSINKIITTMNHRW